MSVSEMLEEYFVPVGQASVGGSPRLVTRSSDGHAVVTRTRVECGSDDPLTDFEKVIVSLHALSAELSQLRNEASDRNDRVTEASQCLEELGKVHDGGGSLFLQVASVVAELVRARKATGLMKGILEANRTSLIEVRRRRGSATQSNVWILSQIECEIAEIDAALAALDAK